MARRKRLTLAEYSRHLPEGVILRYISADKRFSLMRDGYEFATRNEEVVTQWKRPDEVFGYIARRVLGIPKEERKR